MYFTTTGAKNMVGYAVDLHYVEISDIKVLMYHFIRKCNCSTCKL